MGKLWGYEEPLLGSRYQKHKDPSVQYGVHAAFRHKTAQRSIRMKITPDDHWWRVSLPLVGQFVVLMIPVATASTSPSTTRSRASKPHKEPRLFDVTDIRQKIKRRFQTRGMRDALLTFYRVVGCTCSSRQGPSR
ncbi:hypothetical protein DTO271D3_2178 [Paecilomyces variotii]|nr:hypothetical protein DTO169E5_5866 [Paecilomyces variotii]KAJ9317357.1 hypothetical protein DTO271D3_2178 [Paecilomyces variotii]KAJ9392050.1 hypothetical protein DTO063F5_809 [Paecilomyces variotii]